MIHALAFAFAAAVATPAAAEGPSPPREAVRACVEASERAPEAERACIGVEALACIDKDPAAQTTAGIAGCYAAETAAWDALLNATYADLVALSAALTADEAAAGADPVDQEALLREAQRAWIAFRDADCAQEAGHWGEGSMRQAAGAECLLDRTGVRALELIEKRRVFENP